LDSPFVEGNGRTARAAAITDLPEARQMLPGKKIVPERIRKMQPYYAALQAVTRVDQGKQMYLK